jgi:multidrug resistance efflux pump
MAVLVAVAAAGLGISAWSAQAAAREGSTRDIVERGRVEGANSLAIRCEVDSPDRTGTAILQIVPDGKVVQRGEVLVKLDSAMWVEEEKKQQIAVADSSLVAKRAQDDVETAKLAKREYLEGTYPVQVQSIQNDIFVAESQLRRADEDLKALGQAGGKAVPARQLADARFAKEKAGKELALAKARLQVLESLTKEKMLRQLTSDVDAAESRLKIEEANVKFARDHLELINRQVANCTIQAPVAGAVAYERVRVAGGGGGGDFVPAREEGVRVQQHQVILRIQDPTQLQVRARVNESRVSQIKVGVRVNIAADVLPNRELTGSIASISERPEPGSTLLAGLKEYAVVFSIDQPPPELRIGQSADVRIPVRGGAGAATALRGTSQDLRWDKLFQSLDKNGDGRLDATEVPAAVWEQIKAFDANGDGFIDRDEWRAAMQEILKRSPPR